MRPASILRFVLRRGIRKKRVAYHEAGHAVACWALRRGFHHVSIESKRKTAGRVGHRAWQLESLKGIESRLDARIKRLAHREILIDMAGHEAERHYCGEEADCDCSQEERDSIVYLALRLANEDTKEAQALLALHRIKAKKLVQANWPQVEAIARALVDSKWLMAHRVRQICRDVREENS